MNIDRAQGLIQGQHMIQESKDDKAIYLQHGFLGRDGAIPCHPCAATLIYTNNSYDCCSGTVDSRHEDFSRVR